MKPKKTQEGKFAEPSWHHLQNILGVKGEEMKAIEMRIAKDLKAHADYKLCLRCGHMNNGETIPYRKICICAVPVLCDLELAKDKSLNELRRLPQFSHMTKEGEE